MYAREARSLFSPPRCLDDGGFSRAPRVGFQHLQQHWLQQLVLLQKLPLLLQQLFCDDLRMLIHCFSCSFLLLLRA
jgi:hypothetical protein